MTFRWEHALRGRVMRELEESSVTQLLLSNVWVCHTMMKKCDYRTSYRTFAFNIYPLFHFLLRWALASLVASAGREPAAAWRSWPSPAQFLTLLQCLVSFKLSQTTTTLSGKKWKMAEQWSMVCVAWLIELLAFRRLIHFVGIYSVFSLSFLVN